VEELKEGISILGAGSWGTTLANLLAKKDYKVTLWARNAELTKLIKETRENSPYLPGIKLSDKIHPTSSLEEALKKTSLLVCAIPSHGIRNVFEEAKDHVPEDCLIVSASKGIEEGSHLTSSGIIGEWWSFRGLPLQKRWAWGFPRAHVPHRALRRPPGSHKGSSQRLLSGSIQTPTLLVWRSGGRLRT
jgi:hypothetical protein